MFLQILQIFIICYLNLVTKVNDITKVFRNAQTIILRILDATIEVYRKHRL